MTELDNAVRTRIDGRQVTQTITVGDGSGRQGNCLQAAVASLLELPLDEVPHFAEIDDWMGALRSFAKSHGYYLARMETPPSFGLAFGMSPREVSHAVVYRDGAMDWDPHPSSAGLVSLSMFLAFLRPAPGGVT